MTFIEQGSVGAFRQTWRKGNPRSLLQTLIAKNPTADEQKIHDLFWREIEDDKELLRACIEYWLDNNYRSLIRDSETSAPARRPSSRTAASQNNAAPIKEKLEQRVRSEAQTFLLDLIMPNEKRLGDCSGPQCRSFGGFYAHIAKQVPTGRTVQEALSEEQLQKLWKHTKAK